MLGIYETKIFEKITEVIKATGWKTLAVFTVLFFIFSTVIKKLPLVEGDKLYDYWYALWIFLVIINTILIVLTIISAGIEYEKKKAVTKDEDIF